MFGRTVPPPVAPPPPRKSPLVGIDSNFYQADEVVSVECNDVTVTVTFNDDDTVEFEFDTAEQAKQNAALFATAVNVHRGYGRSAP